MTAGRRAVGDGAAGNGLWTPPGARAVLVSALPTGNVRLRDGRLLRRDDIPDGRMVDPDILDYGWWIGPQRLKVLASLDDTPHGKLLHVSLSYPNRDPDWATIKAVRDAFYPETVDVMMVLPRADDYVNVHQHCFQMWQTPTVWGMR